MQVISQTMLERFLPMLVHLLECTALFEKTYITIFLCSARLSNLPNVTQLISDRASILIQPMLLFGPVFPVRGAGVNNYSSAEFVVFNRQFYHV